MLGAAFLPASLFHSKAAAILPASLFHSKAATLGSSISMLISYRRKSIGVKFTLVDKRYVIGTFRVPNGRKIGHFLIPGPFDGASSSKKVVTSFKLKAKSSAQVSIDPNKGTFTTNVKGIGLSRVKFQDSKNDDVPSTQGWLGWLKDKINDVAAGIAIGISYLTGDQASISTSGGGVLSTHKDAGGSTIGVYGGSSGFKAESGLDEQPGVWY